MKAISIHQPWASLIALGHKKFETRTWKTDYRGPLLIHASKAFSHVEQDLCHQEPFISVLKAHGIEFVSQLPNAAIIAVATLTHCHIVEEVKGKLSEEEKAFGDFRGGRYAWALEDIRALKEPVPYKGRQSIFEIPDELVMQALTQKAA